MHSIRRNDLSPRVEMLALIDVIFLLLTFFIYSMVLTVKAQVLPVKLTPLSRGQAAQAKRVVAITIDRDGKFFFDNQQVGAAQLEQRLDQLAGDPEQPSLFLAVEQRSNVDRWPALNELLQRVQQAGITKFSIVGPAKEQTGE